MSIEKAEKYIKEREEKANLSRKELEESKDYNRTLVAAIDGNRDAANSIFRKLADIVETGNATEDDFEIIAKVLREIADNDQAVNFLAAKIQNTKGPRSFLKMQKIYEAVEFLRKEKKAPLISNQKESGALLQVAKKFYMTEVTVKRHYYDYKKLLDRMARMKLLFFDTPENREKLVSDCKQEFEALMSVLTEEMTDEQKQEVWTDTWPSYVDNFINQYFNK